MVKSKNLKIMKISKYFSFAIHGYSGYCYFLELRTKQIYLRRERKHTQFLVIFPSFLKYIFLACKQFHNLIIQIIIHFLSLLIVRRFNKNNINQWPLERKEIGRSNEKNNTKSISRKGLIRITLTSGLCTERETHILDNLVVKS